MSAGCRGSTHPPCGEYHLSAHAQCRLRQRGLSKGDVDLILNYGEMVADGYVVSQVAIERARAELKSKLSRLERLKNVAVVEDLGEVITVYRADKKRLRKLRNRH